MSAHGPLTRGCGQICWFARRFSDETFRSLPCLSLGGFSGFLHLSLWRTNVWNAISARAA